LKTAYAELQKVQEKSFLSHEKRCNKRNGNHARPFAITKNASNASSLKQFSLFPEIA
jgi:hypothetical protein